MKQFASKGFYLFAVKGFFLLALIMCCELQASASDSLLVNGYPEARPIVPPVPPLEVQTLVPRIHSNTSDQKEKPFKVIKAGSVRMDDLPGGIRPLQKSLDQLAQTFERQIDAQIEKALSEQTELTEQEVQDIFRKRFSEDANMMPVTNGEQDDLLIATGPQLQNYIDVIGDARKVIDKAICAGNFISMLTGDEDLLTLPVCISTDGISAGSNLPACTTNPDSTLNTGPVPSFRATMVIEEIRFYSNYTQLYVYVKVESSKLGPEPLIFYSPDIKYSSTAGIIGDAFIGLMGDFPINVVPGKLALTLKRAQHSISSNPTSFSEGTFVKIGCSGPETIALAGSVVFSREWIKPPAQNNTPSTGRISADFAVQVNNDFEVYAQVSLPPFEVNTVNDYIWEVSNMTFDFSEDISPAFINGKTELSYNTVLPNDSIATKVHSLFETGALWKGFHAGTVSVTIPRKLTKGTQEPDSIKVTVNNLIIDETGVAGQATVASGPLVAFGETDMSGWGMSLDQMTLTVVETTNWQAVFDGKLYVPLFKDKNNSGGTVSEGDAIDYVASIDPENGYEFFASLDSAKTIPAWIAKATILESSYLSFGIDQQTKDLQFTAHVDANIEIDGEIATNMPMKLPSLGIRNLQLANHGATKMQFGTFELRGMNTIDLGFIKVEFDTDGGISSGKPEGKVYADNVYQRADIDFFLKVTLAVGEDLTGTGGFVAEGKLDQSTGYDKWVNNDLRLKTVHVVAEEVIPGISYFEAFLEFYKNVPVWGSGFRAFADIRPKALFDKLTAVAQFGKAETTDRKYFMIDAAAEFSPGLSLGPAIQIIGFGGGCYFNMERPNATEAFNQIQLGADSSYLAQYGATLSGVTLTVAPGNTQTFGFMASVVLTNPDPSGGQLGDGVFSAYTANVEFGMQFSKTVGGNNGWGIDLIYFMGSGKFLDAVDFSETPLQVGDPNNQSVAISGMTPGPYPKLQMPQRPPGLPDCLIAAKVLIQFDFVCPSFHGLFGVYVNADDIIYGIAESEIFIGKKCPAHANAPNVHWNVTVGRDTAPNFLALELGFLNAVVSTYFMMGNYGIPSDLNLPTSYMNIFGGVPNSTIPNPSDPASVEDVDLDANLEQVNMQHPDIFSGKGMALGFALELALDLNFLFMYSTIRGGFGFDILLNKLVDSQCTQGLGFKGWYAKGQAWMYVMFELGARLKVFGKNFQVPIIGAAIGSLLRMEGPKPFYASGQLDVEFKVMGFRAKTQFKAKIGQSLTEYLDPACAAEVGVSSQDVIAEIVPTLEESGNGKIPVQSHFLLNLNFVPTEFAEVMDSGKHVEYRIGVIAGWEEGGKGNGPRDKYINHEGQVLPINNSVGSSSSRSLVLRDVTSGINLPFQASIVKKGGEKQPQILVIPDGNLPANSTIRLEASGMLSRRAYWDWNGEEVKKIRTIPLIATFQTGGHNPQVDYVLDDADIFQSYPIKNMVNFYREEAEDPIYGTNQASSGQLDIPTYWLTLNGDHSKIWNPDYLPEGYSPRLRFIDKATGQQVGYPGHLKVAKSATGRDIIWFRENTLLQDDKEYTFQLFYKNTPETINTGPDYNGSMNGQQCSPSPPKNGTVGNCWDCGNPPTMDSCVWAGPMLSTTIQNIDPDFGFEMIIYEMDFRTSAFPTLASKVSSMQQSMGNYYDMNSNSLSSEYDIVRAQYTTSEDFSYLEKSRLLTVHLDDIPSWQYKESGILADLESCGGAPFDWSIYRNPLRNLDFNSNPGSIFFGLRTPDDLFHMHSQAVSYALDPAVTCFPSWRSSLFSAGGFDPPADANVGDSYMLLLKYHLPWGDATMTDSANPLENMPVKGIPLSVDIHQVFHQPTAPPSPPAGTDNY